MHPINNAMLARAALTCGAFFLCCSVALAQEDAGAREQAEDQAEAAQLFDRAGWPQGDTVLAGLRLPDSSLPGLAQSSIDARLELDEALSFGSIGGNLVSVRERRAVVEGGLLSLTVVVAPSQQIAQDALLATIGQTNSRLGNPWVRDAGTGENKTWSTTGDVRFGITTDGGKLPVVAFARANVMVLVRGHGLLAPRALDVALAADEILDQTPERATDGGVIAAVELAGETGPTLAYRSITPLSITGSEGLQLDLAVTGGGIEPTADEGHAYYAGEAGEHTITARAIDGHGFPSSAVLAVEVAPPAR